MTAISKDNPVYVGNDHDAHVNAWVDYGQRQQWQRIKDLERTRYEEQTQRVDRTLQDALALPQQRAPFVAFAEGPDPQAGQVAPVVEPTDSPLPLATGDIASCFAGLHWREEEWKKPLGYPPKWLKACVHTPGQRGVSETRWNPVGIGAALVNDGYAKPNSVQHHTGACPG